MLSIYLFYMCLKCSSIYKKTYITFETSLSDDDYGPKCKKAKFGEYQNMMQYNYIGTYKYSVQYDALNNSMKRNSMVPVMSQEIKIKTQNEKANAQYINMKEKEIFNNHTQRQTTKVEQDIRQKMATCKNTKKNSKNFFDLTDETKKSFYNAFLTTQNKTVEISTKIKKHIKDKKLYKFNIYMKQEMIEAFNLAQYMPKCITKYTYNKEIFDRETQQIKKLLGTGVIDFDVFFDILYEEIVYDNNDKEMLAKLVDVQMNNFLHKNIDSLTLLFPKMQFFMDYYNKYQDDLIFFVDTKHVCMVFGMMHILDTVLQCTEHMISKIKKINSDITECSNSGRKYVHEGINPIIINHLVTKLEIEKMLLYILQSFLPTDHFIDLVNLFHIFSVCNYGIIRLKTDDVRFIKPNKIDSAVIRMSTYCYIYFDALETGEHGTQKNVTHIFFKHFMNVNVITNIYTNLQQYLIPQDLLIRNNCFSIYILRNADKLSDNLKKTYDKLVVIHNYMQSISPPDLTKKNDKNYLETIMINSKLEMMHIFHHEYLSIRTLTHDFYKKKSSKSTSFYGVVCYILNYICDYILASEATFLMSYDITSDKNVIEKIIADYMEIVENWNNTNYESNKIIDTNISFRKPRFYVEKKANRKNNKRKTS